MLCRAVGACVWLGTLEVWGWWLFLFILMQCWQSDRGFWSVCSLQCIVAGFLSIPRNWRNKPVNVSLLVLSLVYSQCPDLKLSCLWLWIMKKSLLSFVLAHNRAKSELPLISGLLGNLTPSYPEVLCTSITVRSHRWEALDGDGLSLPHPSPKDPLIASWFISHTKYLSCCSKLRVRQAGGTGKHLVVNRSQ